MIELTQEELKQHFSEPIFGQISETADALGLECYVVGGYVRDIFLQRPSKDIDVVVVGSGIAMAEALGKRLGRGAHVSVFKNFGTAQVKCHGTEVEFVGARKESYSLGITPSKIASFIALFNEPTCLQGPRLNTSIISSPLTGGWKLRTRSFSSRSFNFCLTN